MIQAVLKASELAWYQQTKSWIRKVQSQTSMSSSPNQRKHKARALPEADLVRSVHYTNFLLSGWFCVVFSPSFGLWLLEWIHWYYHRQTTWLMQELAAHSLKPNPFHRSCLSTSYRLKRMWCDCNSHSFLNPTLKRHGGGEIKKKWVNANLSQNLSGLHLLQQWRAASF